MNKTEPRKKRATLARKRRGKILRMPPMTVDKVCDFILSEVTDGGKPLNHLKLQKLLFYSDAWHIAFEGVPLFPEKFQAWVHGPVSRRIYNRFLTTKDLYSVMTREDITPDFDPTSIPEEIRLHIKSVLETYNPYSGSELEEMTHKEEPWIQARKGYAPNERCEVELDKEFTGKFYASLLK